MGDLFTLRPVQVKALDMMRASIRSGHRRPQLGLATGSGKTVIAAHIVSGALKKKNRVGFVVPLLSLIDQTVERFDENGIALGDMGVVQGEHPLHRPHAPVQVCSVQTLGRREFPAVDVVVVDESHLQYEAIYRWMAEKPGMIFIGLSATPWAKGMADWWDDLLVPATIKELIAAGDLCKFRAFAPTKPDLSNIDDVAGDYHQGQLSALMGKKSITADVVHTWLTKADGRPTMLFAVDRAHAAKLHDEFSSSGVKSAYVDAFTDRDERAALRKLFHSGEIQVVCSVGTMTHGVDWDVRCVQFCRPTKSPILLVQALGRGLRPAPGKDDLLILDHSNSLLELGLPDEIGFEHLRGGKNSKGSGELQKERDPPKPKECPACKHLVAPLVRECPHCGHPFKIISRVITNEGELAEIGDGNKAAAKRNREWSFDDKVAFWAEMTQYAMTHGKNPRYPACAYRDRFGVWPERSLGIAVVTPREPSRETLAWIRSQKIAFIIKKGAAR